MMPGRSRRTERATLAAFALLIWLVGMNVVAVRLSNRELAPFWGAGTRFAVSALVLWVIVGVRGLALPRGHALRGTVLYGLLGFAAFFAFVYWGLVAVQAGLAAVILALVPLLTFFLAIAHRLERFRWRPLAGAVLAAAGIALVFGEQITRDVPPVSLLALLAGALCAAETNIIVKRLPPHEPVATNAVAIAVGAAVLLALSVVSREPHAVPVQPLTWAVFVYLVSLGTIGVFGLFLFVLKRWKASAVAYEFVLAPVVAVVLGSWLTAETVTPVFIAGAALVLAGVYVGALAGADSG
jgi:O-acetylserine/cysteine efflux transporter